MATVSIPVCAGAPGISKVSSGWSASTLRFKVKCGDTFSSSLGELFAGDGDAFTVGITSRVAVPRRTLRLGTSHHQRSSTSRRWLSTWGQDTLKALLDETRPTTEEKQYPVHLLEDEELLKQKGALLVQPLEGTCIYLCGMMGSGKSTVGRGVSEALGYIFFDSDKLVEEAAGGTTIAEMFRAGREEEFRDAETDVLEQLSTMSHLVVATGGGAVIRPENWDSMRRGITVWLDVPLECLARRVVAVGCHSRPLLGVNTEEAAYKQALDRLTRILQERCHMYRNSDVVVSLEEIARERGVDVESIPPTVIAVQVLEEISRKLHRDGGFDGQLQCV